MKSLQHALDDMYDKRYQSLDGHDRIRNSANTGLFVALKIRLEATTREWTDVAGTWRRGLESRRIEDSEN